MPALPLDEAGKYVAAAYVVFMVLLVVYLGIMANKLRRIESDLRELNAIAEARGPRDSEPSVTTSVANPDRGAETSATVSHGSGGSGT